MDRAYASGASATPPTAPASPSVGYPTKGNPGAGTPATKPGEYWFHMVTEEIRAAIVAGGLTPDQNNTTQLRDAILALIAANQSNDFKASVRVATTANIASLAGGAPNTLDGITLVVGDRILVKDQTTASQNGIYAVATLGTGSNGTWARATDADAAGELTSGALLAVEEGTANANSLWMLTTDGTITIGTTALTFARQTTVNLATQVTGVLARANGGTGLSAAGASGNVLMSDGTDWVSTAFSAQQAGGVTYFAMSSAPTGFLKANGALVSRTTYAALFAAIGTTFGAGDGTTTFALPDLRGEFVRGWDDGRNVDSGRGFGSAQTDTMQGHVHDIGASQQVPFGTGGVNNPGKPGATSSAQSSQPATDGTNGTPRYGTETRPRNIALLACIKF